MTFVERMDSTMGVNDKEEEEAEGMEYALDAAATQAEEQPEGVTKEDKGGMERVKFVT